MPTVALSAAVVLGIEGADLLAVAVIACLPTAQNLYPIAAGYDVLAGRVRSIVLLTTALSFRTALLAASLLD